MNKTMMYKGYVGSVEYSEEDRIFYGKVQNIHALISYEGICINALETDFHNAVDDYLKLGEGSSPSPTDQ